jgi:coenzyme F420-0:L-glutamate ligase/coenzyme F420-1:gamma-L-glutamate ligase
MDRMVVTALHGLPLIVPGDDLPGILAASLAANHVQDGDLLVVAQKIVSKAEGAIVNLADVTPSTEAIRLAGITNRDPRHVQVMLDEATEVLFTKGKTIVTRHRLGFIGSSSFVDRSNVAAHGDGYVVLLPRDPDASARLISQAIAQVTGYRVAVIINDSAGRDHRDGSVGTAIGISGIRPLAIEAKPDLFGNMSTSRIALVDELAAAGSVLMGQANEGVPAVLIHGVTYEFDASATIRSLLNP